MKILYCKIVVIALCTVLAVAPTQGASVEKGFNVATDFHITNAGSFSANWFEDIWTWWKELRKSIRVGKYQGSGGNDETETPISVQEPGTVILILVALLSMGAFLLYRRKSKK